MMAQILRRKKETRQRHVGFTRHTEAHDFLRLFLHVHVRWLGIFHGRIFKSGVREFCETGFGVFHCRMKIRVGSDATLWTVASTLKTLTADTSETLVPFYGTA